MGFWRRIPPEKGVLVTAGKPRNVFVRLLHRRSEEPWIRQAASKDATRLRSPLHIAQCSHKDIPGLSRLLHRKNGIEIVAFISGFKYNFLCCLL